ncbi:MAG: DUF368 domain-containing protein [Ruminococcaceae bacterium]|nr:DUF368 domain-containing protein [Oscillospiraceae bacterium]
MKGVIINFLKSVIIGASALIPGISGGTMAIALGIYDALLRSLSRFCENKRKNVLFLLVFVLGAAVGIVAFSGWVLWLFNTFALPMIYFFIGCVFGSVPMLFRRGGIKKIKIVDALWVLLGYLCVTGVSGLPVGLCVVDGSYLFKFIMLFAAGIVIAVAFILPGISTSYILLLLGIYDITLNAVYSFNVAFLLPLVIGALAGTFVCARILENALHRYKGQSYMLIIGFVIGSVFEIVPSLPVGAEIFVCALTFGLGFLLIKIILRYSEEK